MQKEKAQLSQNKGNFLEFFYILTNVFPVKGYFFIILWILQWLIVLAPPFMEIFDQTQLNGLSKFFSYFSILSYLQSLQNFKIISYMMFAVIQLAFILIGIKVLKFKFQTSTSANQIEFKFYHLAFIASGTVLLPINTDLLAYCIKSSFLYEKYPSYKNFSLEYLSANASAYTLIILLSICLIQNLFMAIINIIFCQDRSILNKLFWSPSNWYADLTMVIIHLFTRCYFVIIPNVFLNLVKFKKDECSDNDNSSIDMVI